MKDKKTDGRINSPFRHKVEMEHVGFSYDDHIASYLEKQKAKGDYFYNQANDKVISSYSDMLYGKPYGRHNPEYLDDLGDNQGYGNPFERQYQINKRKSERVSVITKKPAKFQTNLDPNEASQSHFNETNGWRTASEWTDEFKKNWNKSDKVRSGLVSAGGLLASKFANWSWKHMVVAGAATTAALTVGLYSGRTSTPEDSKE